VTAIVFWPTFNGMPLAVKLWIPASAGMTVAAMPFTLTDAWLSSIVPEMAIGCVVDTKPLAGDVIVITGAVVSTIIPSL